MKMESRESFVVKNEDHQAGHVSPSDLYPTQSLTRQGGLSLVQQSSLAEIQLQHHQLLRQFSLLHSSLPSGGHENVHPLYSHGVCMWAGCDADFRTVHDFRIHLARSHILDDKSTAQTKVQIQIVEQLEGQLNKEQRRLEAMMDHMKDLKQVKEDLKLDLAWYPAKSPPPHPSQAPPPSLARHPFLSSSYATQTKMASQVGPVRRKEEKSLTEGSEAYQRCIKGDKGANIDMESEMSKNRDFYRVQDVRPPFTYAALIRQAINESSGRQLTLNEIYNWFQANFAFFRRNAATWKNAVRHNLSLHKCFSRVENVKGAVWTVDELEFHRRRPQRNTEGNSVKNSPPSQTENTFNQSLHTALYQLGRRGVEEGAGEENYTHGPPPLTMAVSPPRMIKNEDLQRCNLYNIPIPLKKNEEDKVNKEDTTQESLEIAQSVSDATSNKSVTDSTGEDMEDDLVPQDLSIISHREKQKQLHM